MRSKTPAQRVLGDLVAAGYRRCQFRVRMVHNTIYIDILDATVPRPCVHRIAAKYEHVTRDAQGVALLGGNTYLEVRYAAAVIEPRLATARDQLLAAAPDTSLEIEGHRVSRVGADGVRIHTPLLVSREPHSALRVTSAQGTQLSHGLRRVIEDNLDTRNTCRCQQAQEDSHG